MIYLPSQFFEFIAEFLAVLAQSRALIKVFYFISISSSLMET